MKKVFFVLLFISVMIRTSLTQCKSNEVACNRRCIPNTAVCEDNVYDYCKSNEFQCKNSKCILKLWVCDTINDCGDGSDENDCPSTDPNAPCRPSQFACSTNSQCIPKNLQCDSNADCMDNSDERGCRAPNIIKPPENMALNTGDILSLTCEAEGVPVPIISWRYNMGQLPRLCKTWTNNGIGNLTCLNIQPQHKGSYFCEAKNNNKSSFASSRAVVYVSYNYRGPPTDECVLPAYPRNGQYTVPEMPDAYPSQLLNSVFLNFTCDSGYTLIGESTLYCTGGWWSDDQPKCVLQCPLEKHPSIVYWCQAKGPLQSWTADKECGELVPDGAIVRPECREPNYHYTGGFIHSSSRSHYDYGVLTMMHCLGGIWDYVPTCSPKCGIVISQGDPLVTNGTTVKRGELPWHAAVYRKTTNPYEQICGGTLISNTIIISAAHCFWSDLEKRLPAQNYAVALGKLYRHWSDSHETDVQKSNVRDIKVPPRFRGMITNFQDDIALVILATTVEYNANVHPICIDFNINFERRQLTVGNKGKVAGWGLTAQDGKESPVLKVTDLPYVDIERCFAESPFSFQSYITSDKFCAGFYNGTGSALCKGDSGGGLVFPSQERADERYYLRGVVSTAPRNDHACNTFVYTTFTQISRHQAFIQEHLI